MDTKTDLTAPVLHMATQWMHLLEEYFDPDIGDGDSYVEGELRVWHKDGWSPGYFTNMSEDFWTFRLDYKER